ncbi:MAG: cytochrome c family protein [Pseudomonadota bacterium]
MRLPIVAAFALIMVACGDNNTSSSIAENPQENQFSTAESETTIPPETVDEAPVVAPTAAADTAGDSEPSAEFAALPAPYNAADYARGRRTFRQCSSCHLVAEGGGNLVGPNLYGMFGRQAGALESFNYSDAVKDADFIWTPERLDEWLANPRAFLPGNRMTFAGVRREDDRTAVIAYLMVEAGWVPE